ncbi:hypothetical protein HYPSUDRAFT_122964, partial [Hypholoma sublateritium FD-334 SS-4]
ELDQRIRSLPPGYGLRHFKNGFSALSQVSGPERKNMAKILLGCLVGSIPPDASQAIAALLDFIYIAQYPTHDTTTLGYLSDARDRFHNNRDYFITVGVRDHFNIPKFHSLLHYIDSIKEFGTTDNYNTEMFERLHIDFAKNGWRATNQRDEFPQMVKWLSRQEKISSFENRLNYRAITTDSPPLQKPLRSIPKYPNFPNRRLDLIEEKHNAPNFSHYLKGFLNKLSPHPIPLRQLEDTSLPFTKVDIYNTFRFNPVSIHEDEEQDVDAVKAMPKSRTRIGRVRVIFTLPKVMDTRLGPQELPEYWPKTPLAYVEWYSPI